MLLSGKSDEVVRGHGADDEDKSRALQLGLGP